MSLMKRINNVGDSAEPCGTLAFEENNLKRWFLCVMLYVW